MASEQPPTATRKPYTGSCHCKHTTYVVYLSLPHTPHDLARPDARKAMKGKQRMYRCNCTTCHKAGILHIRVGSAPDDFLLLSPLDPLGELASTTAVGHDPHKSLSDYTCYEKQLHFLFCPKCGGRCLTYAGPGERIEVDIAALGLPDDAAANLVARFSGRSKVSAWRPSKERWVEAGEDPVCYLSVNAYTLDAGQEGLDLREWTEKKWVMYLDCLDFKGAVTHDAPHPGGAY